MSQGSEAGPGRVVVVDHPLVQHKLSLMRSKDTGTSHFRTLLREISMLMAYEVTRDLPLVEVTIETPLETMQAPLLVGRKLVLASILRAGTGMLDGMLEIIPSARVGHVGLYRDPDTLEAVEYYFKMPEAMPERDVVVVDPMLATAGSSIAAVERIQRTSPKSLRFLCLVAAPEGIDAFHSRFPEIPIYTAAVDRQLNDHAYILPGLGDAGDRMFGT